MTYQIRQYSNITEAVTRREIIQEFRKWKVTQYDFPIANGIGEAAARVRFVLRDIPMDIDCSSQRNYKDNLRCIYFAIYSMRMDEKRGISDVLKKAYLQLSAPEKGRDPYEVLGVRPDTSLEDIEAMYKIKAKRLHSDVGGDDEQMKELNIALEKIKVER